MTAALNLITVIFIGGYGSTPAQTEAWKKSAEELRPYKFQTVPLQLTASKTKILRSHQSTLKKLVQQIDETSEAETFVVAGHSSGSALASEIVRQVKNKSKVRLVILDGFFPGGISPEIKVDCWSAVDIDTGMYSFNSSTMKRCTHYHELKVSGCQNKQCLHFSLVNSSAPKLNLNLQNFTRTGYKQVKSNLVWLTGL